MMHTALYNRHKTLGAKLVDFHGWEMPLEYSGVVKEHEAVRRAAGLFDVGHMGTVEVGGAGAEAFLRRMLTFRPEALEAGRARYCFLLNARGGMKDDLMAFRLDGSRFLLVVNAGTAEKDIAWLRENSAGLAVEILDLRPDTSIMALQGPASWDIIRDAAGVDPAGFKYHSYIRAQVSGMDAMIAKTGYTGEKGFELYVPNRHAEAVWDALMRAGEKYGLVPCGLGARDTLRLEMGYLLYGADADEDTNPVEAGYEAVIDFGNEDFIGRDALLAVKDKGPGRMLRGLMLNCPGIPRHGCAIVAGGEDVGAVTSGNFSPMLKKGIALGYVKAGAPLDDVKIDIRGKLHEAEVVKIPFYKK